MCAIIIVKCSWDGLPEGRNCSCVWSFWCSELCSVDQTVTVQRESVLDERGPKWFWQPLCSICMCTVLGEWGGLYQWFTQQSGLPSAVFWGQIWKCRGWIQWWQSRTVSADPVAGWTSSAVKGRTTSAGPFSQWKTIWHACIIKKQEKSYLNAAQNMLNMTSLAEKTKPSTMCLVWGINVCREHENIEMYFVH